MGKVRKQWSYDQIKLAISAIRSGESIGHVSKRTGIPKSTLWGKLTGKRPMNKKVGPPTVLTSEEEKIIGQWIFHLSNRGFPITKRQLINNVENFVKNLNRATPFTNNRPGRHWYEGFLRRHPDISLRVAQNLSVNRSSVTEEKLITWFRKIKVQLDKIGIDTFDGSRIFNLDESAFCLCSKTENVQTEKEDNAVSNLEQNDEKECLTVLFTTNAMGLLAPPMVLFKYERIPYSIIQDAPSDWAIGKSSSGGMTVETLFEYIANIFHPWLIKENIQRPVVLFVDGYSSHVTYPTIQFCSANQIELISLIPNSAHILQPLNVALFKPLKEAWGKTTSEFCTQKQSKIREEDFCRLLKSTVDSLNLPNIMYSAFRKTGLYPFSPDELKFNDWWTTLKRSKSTTSVSSSHIETSETLGDNETNESITSNYGDFIFQSNEINFDGSFNQILPDEGDKESIADNSKNPLMNSIIEKSNNDTKTLGINNETNMENLMSVVHNEYRVNIPNTETVIGIPNNVPDIFKKSLFWSQTTNVFEKNKLKRKNIAPSVATLIGWKEQTEIEERERQKKETTEKRKRKQEEPRKAKKKQKLPKKR